MRQDTESIIKAAKKRARQKAKLYKEFIVFFCVSILLILINAFAGGPPWFQWAVFPYGIFLVMRALLLRVSGKVENWEEKEITRQLKKRGIAREDVYLEEDDNDEFDLDDLPQKKQDPLPQKRWDDRDFV